MSNHNPAPYIVVYNSRLKKTQRLSEAKSVKTKLDTAAKENYPWEKRRAHVYSLLR